MSTVFKFSEAAHPSARAVANKLGDVGFSYLTKLGAGYRDDYVACGWDIECETTTKIAMDAIERVKAAFEGQLEFEAMSSEVLSEEVKCANDGRGLSECTVEGYIVEVV